MYSNKRPGYIPRSITGGIPTRWSPGLYRYLYTIGIVIGQLYKVFRLERSKEDLLKILNINYIIALIKTKKGFLTFRIPKRDY